MSINCSTQSKETKGQYFTLLLLHNGMSVFEIANKVWFIDFDEERFINQQLKKEDFEKYDCLVIKELISKIKDHEETIVVLPDVFEFDGSFSDTSCLPNLSIQFKNLPFHKHQNSSHT